MGVTGLWPILWPVKRHKSLTSLRGQTLAVDLSMWVCENQGVRRMQHTVLKPHLRNLFFRISSLLQLGVRLVFVIEGEAPALKHGEMSRRLQARHRGTATANTKRKFGRGRLQGHLKECCELLDALGVPYVQSQGEAESTCAALNAAGVVDACVSDDGDCFLYGARVVYRNLTLDSKDPHVESFSMEDVTSDLALTRERLVALALLLGCDYCPAGVPGVGETWAIRLMASLHSMDVLSRFRQWSTMTESDCVDSTESFVWRRASALPGFPPQKVIEEFLMPKDPVLSSPPQWSRPCILSMMRLCCVYLEWPAAYSLEKTLPLATLWGLMHCAGGSPHTPHTPDGRLIPARIVKRRVRHGVHCLEVEWQNSIRGLVDVSGQPRQLVTVEQEARFQACFPALVHDFNQLRAQTATRGRKGKAKTHTDTLSGQLDALTISGQSDPTDDPTQADLVDPSQTDLRDDPTRLDPADGITQAAASCRPQSQALAPPQAAAPQAPSSGAKVSPTVGPSSGSSPPPPRGLSAPSEGLRADVDRVSHDVRAVDTPAVTAGEENGHVCDGEGSSVRSPGVINRTVEYVPLSQRLAVLRERESTATENSDAVDLDDSCIYIPLSQRLRARLGGQQKAGSLSSAGAGKSLTTSVGSGKSLTASVWSGKSWVTCSQDSSPCVVNSSLTDIPLSQRGKHTVDCQDEGLTPPSSPEGSEMAKTANNPTASDTEVAVESAARWGVHSPVCEAGGGRSEMRVGDGVMDPQSATQSMGDNSVPSQAASSACMAGDSQRLVACPVRDRMPGAGSDAGQVSSHLNNLSDAGDSVGAFQSASGSHKQVPRPAKAQNKNPPGSVSGRQKPGKKKPTMASRQGSKGVASSQRVGQVVCMTDLLQDWSDSEAIGNKHSTSVITVSSNDSDQEVSSPSAESSGRCLTGKLPPEVTEDVDYHPSKGVCPESSTPSQSSVLEARSMDSPQDGESFVSDGHFTLHHTLFTSMEDRDEGGETTPGPVEQESDHTAQPRQHTECSPPHSHLSPAHIHRSPTHTHLSPPHTDDPQTWSDRLGEHPPWGQASELEGRAQRTTRRSSSQDNGPFLVTDPLLAVDGPVCCSVADHDGPSEVKGLPAAAPVVSPHQTCEAAEPSELGVEDEVFLPLSQRLRLKPSTARALNAMTGMF